MESDCLASSFPGCGHEISPENELMALITVTTRKILKKYCIWKLCQLKNKLPCNYVPIHHHNSESSV